MPTAEATIARLSQLLQGFMFDVRSEAQLQSAIEQVLVDAGERYEREFILSTGSRVDFFCNGVCVEVKIAGPSTELIRQIHRYAQEPLASGVLVVTTRRSHSSIQVSSLAGKPVKVLVLEGGLA